jgi:hypothetical protein
LWLWADALLVPLLVGGRVRCPARARDILPVRSRRFARWLLCPWLLSLVSSLSLVGSTLTAPSLPGALSGLPALVFGPTPGAVTGQ